MNELKFSQKFRTKYLINPKFQLTIIGYSLFLSAIIISTVMGLINYQYRHLLQVGLEMGLEKNHVFFRLIKQQSDLMGDQFISATIIIFVFVKDLICYQASY